MRVLGWPWGAGHPGGCWAGPQGWRQARPLSFPGPEVKPVFSGCRGGQEEAGASVGAGLFGGEWGVANISMKK